MILAAFALVQATASQPPAGVFLTGNDLYEECRLRADNRSVCMGYVMAVSDAVHDAELISHRAPTICLRDGVGASQLVGVVVRYIRDHPEIRDASANSMAVVALQRAFPCAPTPAH